VRDRNLATHDFFQSRKVFPGLKIMRCGDYYITGSDSTSSVLEERMIRIGL
jgi:hypothetical protein